MKRNCWEVKGCGRQPGGENVKDLGLCPTPLMNLYHGINGGENGGRVCWLIAGTLCEGEVQGTFLHKLESCADCDFYQSVKDEEGENFRLPLSVLEIMLCKLK